MIEALVSGPVGVILGWALSYVQGRRAAAQAERERLLAQMQQLVIAVTDLDRARRMYTATHAGWRQRAAVLTASAAEFLAEWTRRGRGWSSAPAALAPASRVISTWETNTMEGAREVTLAMSRVAAAGLPLGMSSNAEVAAAAQRLMDVSLEDRGQESLESAIRELRHAFYPNEPVSTSSSPSSGPSSSS